MDALVEVHDEAELERALEPVPTSSASTSATSTPSGRPRAAPSGSRRSSRRGGHGGRVGRRRTRRRQAFGRRRLRRRCWWVSQLVTARRPDGAARLQGVVYVREDLRHHQRGGRPARGGHGRRRGGLHLRPVAPADRAGPRRRHRQAAPARDPHRRRLPRRGAGAGGRDRRPRRPEGRAAARPRDAAGDTSGSPSRVPFVIKAFAAGDPAVAKGASTAPTPSSSTRRSPGSGQVFDWKLADGAPPGMPLMLAGGLDPDNVADAIAAVQPVGRRRGHGVESGARPEGPAQAARVHRRGQGGVAERRGRRARRQRPRRPALTTGELDR